MRNKQHKKELNKGGSCMLRKKLAWGYIIWWFITWGISWLLSIAIGSLSQGDAFLWVYFCSIGIYYFLLAVLSLIVCGKEDKTIKFPFVAPSVVVVLIASALLISWGASKLYGVEFVLVYQFISLGQSMALPRIRMKRIKDND